MTEVNELFTLLGNETRRRILEVLWEHFDYSLYVTETQEGIRFADLRDGADVNDPGNFNYHLNKLQGTFIESTPDGYVLSPLGYNIMRSIERYESFEYSTRGPWTLPDPCPYCEDFLRARYHREVLEVSCPGCDGMGRDGNFTFVQIPLTGSDALENSALLDIAILRLQERVTTSKFGYCWDCTGPIEISVQICQEHQQSDEHSCPDCMNRYRATASIACSTCGTSGFGPLIEYAIASPRVKDVFASAESGPQDIGPWRYRLLALDGAQETVETTNEPVMQFRFETACSETEIEIREADSIGLQINPLS